MKQRALVAAWTATFLMALSCLAVALPGFVRDSHTGDPVARFDPRAPTGWVSVPFDVRGTVTYDLVFASVSDDPDTAGRPFNGVLDVRIRDPQGRLALGRFYDGAAFAQPAPDRDGDAAPEHVSAIAGPRPDPASAPVRRQRHAPNDEADDESGPPPEPVRTERALGSIVLNGSLRRPWRLEVRVAEGDPRFVAQRTEVRLRRQHAEAGTGRMMTYAGLPAGVLLLLALGLAVPLVRAGTKAPIFATAAVSAALLVLVA